MLLRPEVTLSSHYSPEPQRVLSGSCALRPQTFLCSLSPGSALFVLGRDNECFGSFIGVTSSPWCGKR